MRSLSYGALARVAANHRQNSAIADHVCGNRGQGGFEPKQYRIDRRRQFRRLLCADCKVFKWGLIAASAGDDDLFITAPVLQLCIHVQKAWRAARARDEDSALSQSYVWGGLRRIIEIQNPGDWVAPSHPFFSPPFRSFAKTSRLSLRCSSHWRGNFSLHGISNREVHYLEMHRWQFRFFHSQKGGGGEKNPKCSSKRHSCPHTLQLPRAPSLILVDSQLCQVSSPSFLRSLSPLLHSSRKNSPPSFPPSNLLFTSPIWKSESLSCVTTSSLSVSASPSSRQTPSSWWLPGLCARWDAN